jgi:hypothetical protein
MVSGPFGPQEWNGTRIGSTVLWAAGAAEGAQIVQQRVEAPGHSVAAAIVEGDPQGARDRRVARLRPAS